MEVNNFGPKDLVAYREPTDMTALVNKASENLRELMLTVDTSENGPAYEKDSIDSNMIDEIINALKKLDGERLWIHESVEAETIKSSVLRHKLCDFPRETDWEIAAAVKVVRDSNNAVIRDYKDKIIKTRESHTELRDKADHFKKANDIIGEKQKELREDYDNTLNILNQTLMEKSNMQIKLNNTREDLRDTKVRIKEFEVAFVELNEDMITERHESDAEQTRLKAQIDETVEKLNQQRKVNMEKKKDFDVVQEKQFISAANLAQVEESAHQAEEKNESLQNQFDELSQLLQKKMRESLTLTAQRNESTLEMKELQKLYEKEKSKLEYQIQNVVSQLETTRSEFTALNKEKICSVDMLETEMRADKQNQEDVEETLKNLQLDREDLQLQSTECMRLKRQNAETQAAVIKTQQEHIASTEIISKEIESSQESLEAEKKERQILQSKRDAIIKEANEYVNDFNAFAARKTQSINEGKVIFQNKSVEGRKLQNKLKDVETSMKVKQKELQESKANYIQMQRDMKGKAKKLQGNISKLETDLSTRQQKYDAELPDFSLLQEAFAKRTEEFQQIKMVVVEVKTKKADFEGTVDEKLGRLNDMEVPKKMMIDEISELRKSYLDQLNAESLEMRSLESQIYETDKKLSSVEVQNNKFKKAIEYFESEIAFMERRMTMMKDGKLNIDITTEEYRGWLEMQWRKHMELDKMYHDQDILLLDDIKHVEEMTSERERRILQIHGKLEEHLDALSTFIENVADMRPKNEMTMVS